MSPEIKSQPVSAIGLALSQRVAPSDELLPSKATVEARLQEFFSAVHEKNLRSLDEIRQFVLHNEQWDVYPEGDGRRIDTGFLTAEGTGVHISLSSPASLIAPDLLSDTELIQAVRAEAEAFQMVHYSKEAIDYARSIIAPGQSLLSLLRGTFKQDEALVTIREKGEPRHDTRMETYFTNGHITAYLVALSPEGSDHFVENETRALLESAHVQRARYLAEEATHGKEYDVLLKQYVLMTHWSDEVRSTLRARLLEIQALNGYTGNDIRWQAVIPASLDKEAEETQNDIWDEASIIGLRAQLQTSAELEVLRAEVQSNNLAAQALKALGVNKPTRAVYK